MAYQNTSSNNIRRASILLVLVLVFLNLSILFSKCVFSVAAKFYILSVRPSQQRLFMQKPSIFSTDFERAASLLFLGFIDKNFGIIMKKFSETVFSDNNAINVFNEIHLFKQEGRLQIFNKHIIPSAIHWQYSLINQENVSNIQIFQLLSRII